MKPVPVIPLVLFATICAGSVLAETSWRGDAQRRESGDRPGGGSVIRESAPPGTTQFRPRRDLHDHDGSRGRDGDHDHHRFPHHPRAIIGVPIIVEPGYYYPPPVYVEPVPRYVEPIDGYWYYCPDVGYYPAVQVCPNGWLKVVPNGP